MTVKEVSRWCRSQIKQRWKESSPLREPAGLIVASVAVMKSLLVELGIRPIWDDALFYLGATLASLGAFYGCSRLKSKWVLALATIVCLVCLSAYRHLSETLLGVTDPKTAAFLFLYVTGVASLFAALRILKNIARSFRRERKSATTNRRRK